MTSTETAVRPFQSLAAAARAWGAARGIVGRPGGYLNAQGFTAYDALPVQLRAPRGVRQPENVRKAVRTFGIWDSRSVNGHAVQGWDSLGRILIRIGEITEETTGRRVRYVPRALPVVKAVPGDNMEPTDLEPVAADFPVEPETYAGAYSLPPACGCGQRVGHRETPRCIARKLVAPAAQRRKIVSVLVTPPAKTTRGDLARIAERNGWKADPRSVGVRHDGYSRDDRKITVWWTRTGSLSSWMLGRPGIDGKRTLVDHGARSRAKRELLLHELVAPRGRERTADELAEDMAEVRDEMLRHREGTRRRDDLEAMAAVLDVAFRAAQARR